MPVSQSFSGAIPGSSRRSRNLSFALNGKPEFQNKLSEQQSKKLRQDIIIRDVRRMDTYPEISKGSGVSSWFRAGLIDTYERGIMVGLSWEGLVKEHDGWRYANYQAGETNEETLALTGYIPYENIESVDWTGDDYYGFPYVYYYFAFKGEPYERIRFCRKLDNNCWEFFTEVAEYKAVRALTKKYGIRC